MNNMAYGGRWIVSLLKPPGYVHIQALYECAEGFLNGLKALGFEARFGAPQEPCDHVLVFGAHLMSPDSRLPAHAIIYNTEQLVDWSKRADQQPYFDHLARHEVWDYSDANIAVLRARAHGRVGRIGLGYEPGLTRIPAGAEQDIDVLFYGSRNDRRAAVLQQLVRSGLKVQALGSVYGAERDAYIARSKVVLNVHFYPSATFEIARVSYLLANHKAVVCEHSVVNEDDASLLNGMAYVPYEELVSACAKLVSATAMRKALEQRGFELFSAQRQSLLIARALGLSPQATDAVA